MTFENDTNDFRVINFEGKVLASTVSARFPPGIRFFPDPVENAFVVTYKNQVSTCFARFDLELLQVIENSPNGRCYSGVVDDAIAYSPRNAGFFVQTQSRQLFFFSLNELPVPRFIYPLMDSIPLKWPQQYYGAMRLSVLRDG